VIKLDFSFSNTLFKHT